MDQLHSNFPNSRDVNPTKFDHLMSEWKHTLDAYFNNTNRLVFNVKDISHDLNYPGIYTALNYYIGQHKLIHESQLAYYSNSIWQYLRFILFKKFEVNERIDGLHGTLIYLERLQSITENLEKQVLPDRSCKLFSLAEFKQMLQTHTPDIEFLFKYLVDNGSVQYKDNVVKLSPIPIQISDMQVLSVKSTLNKLLLNIPKMELDIKTLTQEIYENKTNKPKALMLLKKKKQLQKLLHQRFTTIQTLEEMLIKIDQCETDKEIMDAYQHGATVIKDTIKAYGLSVDKVQDNMEMVQQVLDEAEEIQDAMPSLQLDADLEAEFEEMLQKDQKIDFPTVPLELKENRPDLQTRQPIFE